MGGSSNCHSSIDSSTHPSLSSLSNSTTGLLSTDLKLGQSIPTSQQPDHNFSNSREKCSNWPPIKSLLRSRLAENGINNYQQPQATLFVKVYMEGVPIGRKLDLLALHSYQDLLRTLQRMFETTILRFDFADQASSNGGNVLTYKDKEGDWMMVGDVPWEMFLSTVKRLKITRANKC